LYDQHPWDESAAHQPRCVPFDASRRGIVPGEGAGVLVLERRSHAVKRDANIWGRVCSFASRFHEPEAHYGGSGKAIAAAARSALQEAGLEAHDISHVCAQGFSHPLLDIEESVAIRQVVGDVPVTAFSSYFGTAGAASGMLELIASLLALEDQHILPTLNHDRTDPECPVNVCTRAVASDKPHFLKISFTAFGHAAAAVLECEK
jgi:3-oxoacyl-[acyl-carrier-protein] synthase II